MLRQYVLIFGILSVAASSYPRTINVKTSGAHGDGLADDTLAINRAISRSRPGDTIYFPPGVYRIQYPPGIILQHTRTYQGDKHGRSILVGSGGYPVASSARSEAFDITLEDLTFDGGGVFFAGDTQPAQYISITRCRFRNIVTGNENWTSHMGILFGAGAQFSSIRNNFFTNIFTGGQYDLKDRDATGIFGYGLSNSVIADNIFDKVNEGIHIFFDRTPGTDVVIARNRFTRIHRMAIELQNDHTDGLRVEGNFVTRPLNPYWLTYGISVAATSMTEKGIIISHNTVVANTELDKSIAHNNYYPYGIEAWGTNTVVSGNRIAGLWGIGIGIGTAHNMVVRENLICGKVAGYGKAINQYYGPQPGTRLIDNTVTKDCPEDLAVLTGHDTSN